MFPALPAEVVSSCLQIFHLLEKYSPFLDNFFALTSPVHEFTSGAPEVDGCGNKGRHHLWYRSEVWGLSELFSFVVDNVHPIREQFSL